MNSEYFMTELKVCNPQSYPLLNLEKLRNLLKPIMPNLYIYTHDNLKLILFPKNQSINILMNSRYFMTELKVCDSQSYHLFKLERL